MTTKRNISKSQKNDLNEIKYWEQQLIQVQLRLRWSKEDYAKRHGEILTDQSQGFCMNF